MQPYLLDIGLNFVKKLICLLFIFHLRIIFYLRENLTVKLLILLSWRSFVPKITMENKVSHRPIPSYRGRCFTVRFGRDGAAVESGVKCTGEMGKKQVFLYLRQNNTF